MAGLGWCFQKGLSGVWGHARKNSHKSKGLYRAKEYESDVLDKTLSQFYAFRISLILPSLLLVPVKLRINITCVFRSCWATLAIQQLLKTQVILINFTRLMRLPIQIDVAHRSDVTRFTSPYTNRGGTAVLFPAIAHHICNVELSLKAVWKKPAMASNVWLCNANDACPDWSSCHGYARLRQWPHHRAGITDVQLPVNPFSMKK